MTEPPRKPRYKVRKAQDNSFYWILQAINGEIVAQSETYTSSDDAWRGVEAARKASSESQTDE